MVCAADLEAVSAFITFIMISVMVSGGVSRIGIGIRDILKSCGY